MVRASVIRALSIAPVAQERVEQRGDGLVRITLKKAYTDGTIAVDMDPLSLRCRLATSVPPSRLHTIRYAGVLAPASPWRSRLAPHPPQAAAASDEPGGPDHAGGYRPCPRRGVAATENPGVEPSDRAGLRSGGGRR